jgi:hypothetical protein
VATCGDSAYAVARDFDCWRQCHRWWTCARKRMSGRQRCRAGPRRVYRTYDPWHGGPGALPDYVSLP